MIIDILITLCVADYVKKEIPAHLAHKVHLVDPKAHANAYRPPKIKESDMKPKVRDPTRRKDEYEVPRVHHTRILMEDMHEHEVGIHDDHLKEA